MKGALGLKKGSVPFKNDLENALHMTFPSRGAGGGSVAVSVMMMSKSYGMFWVQTQPCTPE